MDEDTDKMRISFDFSKEAYDQLEDLRCVLGASSKAAVVKKALTLLAETTKNQADGYNLVLQKDGKEHIWKMF